MCGCWGHIWGSQRPLPASVCVGDTTGTPSPACPGSVHVMGRRCLPQPSLPARPGCVCGLGGGEQRRGASTTPRPGSPPPQLARCGRSETCRIPRLRPEEAGGWGGPNSRAPSANLGAAKPQTAKLGSPGARPSPDPLPPSLRPSRRAPSPQFPARAFLTFPSSGGPAGEDLIRRVANPQERPASPAAEPGARPEGGAPPAAPGPLQA